MRKIDTIVGNLVCLILYLFERMRSCFLSNKTAMQEPHKILVIKYLGMGSLLYATPAMSAIKKKHPACKIVLLTFEESRELSEIIQLFDTVFTVRTGNIFVLLKDTFSTLAVIRRDYFEYVLDLEFFSRYSTIVSYLSEAKCRVGYSIPQIWRGNLLHIPVQFNHFQHISRVFADQIEALGIAVDDCIVGKLEIFDDSLLAVKKLLLSFGVQLNLLLIGVNINASNLAFERRWHKENFIRLIEVVSKRYGVTILLIGSKSEEQYVTDLYNDLSGFARQRTFNLSGKTDLKELVALFSLMDLFITNDSGPLHIAAATGVKTVSFFGPETPQLYGPQGGNHCVFYAGIECSPCLNALNAKIANCAGDNRCMRAIRSEEVIEVVCRLLDEV